MKREDITDVMVRKVGDGVREFNVNSEPSAIHIRIVDGVQQPLGEAQQAAADDHWYQAIRYGLEHAVD